MHECSNNFVLFSQKDDDDLIDWWSKFYASIGDKEKSELYLKKSYETLQVCSVSRNKYYIFTFRAPNFMILLQFLLCYSVTVCWTSFELGEPSTNMLQHLNNLSTFEQPLLQCNRSLYVVIINKSYNKSYLGLRERAGEAAAVQQLRRLHLDVPLPSRESQIQRRAGRRYCWGIQGQEIDGALL